MTWNRSPHPKQRGRGVAFLMGCKMITLVWCYLLGSLALVFFFATLYALTASVVDGTGSKQQPFWACVYFSVTTHATVGYGDLTPIRVGRLFMGLQAILATLYNVLFLGVIVTKALWAPQSIVVSPIVIFDTVEQKFRFRFYNAHRLPLCDTKYTICLRGVGASENQLLYRNFRIETQYPGHPFIESAKPWIVNTKPCKETNATSEILDAAKENILCPEHFKENSHLILQIEGKYPGLGGQVCLTTTRIHVSNIRCGKLALVETIDTSGAVQMADWRNFDKYEPVTTVICKACKRHKNCFLAKRIIGE